MARDPAVADALRRRLAVFEGRAGDLGSWDALLETRDGPPEAVRAEGEGDVIIVGGQRSLVRADGDRLVVVVGVRDTIVVDTPDALLVCAADTAQDVKLVVERLIAEGRTERL